MYSSFFKGTKAVKLSRKFEFRTSSGSRRSQQQKKTVDRLTDYYFWNLEDLQTKLAFVCERKQKDIGCIHGNGMKKNVFVSLVLHYFSKKKIRTFFPPGESYRGNANRGESGDACVMWDTPELSFVLDDDKIPNLGPLAENNFCRNPDGDSSPWCIAPNGEFDYCDIPQCGEDTEDMSTNEIDTTTFVTENSKCEGEIRRGVTRLECCLKNGFLFPAHQFQCRPGECILSAYTCDGYEDCENGEDEAKCNKRNLDDFKKVARSRLEVPFVERWLHTSAEACAQHCKVGECSSIL